MKPVLRLGTPYKAISFILSVFNAAYIFEKNDNPIIPNPQNIFFNFLNTFI